MAMILEKSVFFHFPKTGGTFIREVIKQSGINHTEDNPADLTFHTIDPDRYPQHERLKSFIFIRHPLEWYASYWNHRNSVGWEGDLHPGWNALQIYQTRQADDFTGFLEQVLDEGTPFISQHKPLILKMDHIGRFEHLRDDLCRIIRATGENIPSELVKALPKKNVLPYPGGEQFCVPRSLYLQMLDLERWMFDYFCYPEASSRFILS